MSSIDIKSINTIRVLSADGIEKAKSGTFFTPQKGRGEFQSVILISSFACVK